MASQKFRVGSFTNVILKYWNKDGELSEIKCHKAVLCWRSAYFKTILEKEDVAQVRGHTIVPLDKDADYDDNDIGAIVKYMYTGEYEVGKRYYWRHDLQCFRLARNYGLPELEQKSVESIEDCLASESLHSIASMLGNMQKHDYESDRLVEMLERIRQKYADQLANDPRLARLSGEKAIMKESLDKIAKQSQTKMRCTKCDAHQTFHFKGSNSYGDRWLNEHNWIHDVDDELADSLD